MVKVKMKFRVIKAKVFIRFPSISKAQSCEWENLSPGALTYENNIMEILHVNLRTDAIWYVM